MSLKTPADVGRRLEVPVPVVPRRLNVVGISPLEQWWAHPESGLYVETPEGMSEVFGARKDPVRFVGTV